MFINGSLDIGDSEPSEGYAPLEGGQDTLSLNELSFVLSAKKELRK